MITAAQPMPVSRVSRAAYARGGGAGREPRPISLALDANEGIGPDSAFLDRVRLSVKAAKMYPSTTALESQLAAEIGVDPARVVVTAGADDAIERLCRVMCEAGREALMTDPTFEMIPRFVAFTGGASVCVPWLGGSFPVAEFEDRISERTSLICVVTPNNPTGSAATIADIRRLRAAAPHAAILVDLAYGEFADEDLTREAAALPNTVITRTFSKAWGMAGLRVGFAVCDERIAPWLRTSGLPYACSGLSLAAAGAWRREGAGAVRTFVEQVRRERVLLTSHLRQLGAEVVDSQANFVFARFRDASLVADLLAGLGIAVRRYASSPTLKDYLRITIAIGDDARRLREAFTAILTPQAILFDMDGVIADVSQSYRRAIIETAAAFGVEVTMADIAAMKAKGDANNDWVVTRRLIEAKGVPCSLEDVTARFEALYQGVNGTPGLRNSERLLIPRADLAAIGARYRLGVVTGRPRRDAERFLAENDLAGLFQVVVCMEDTTYLKPNPEPVLLALAKLKTSHAWMIGDTPDDVVASRAAAVVPIGVVPPGEEFEKSSAVLLAAGAGRVLANLDQLEEILP